MRKLIWILAILLLSSSAMALEIADVSIDDTVSLNDGTVLQLNGAGIRKKFFFKIYIAELYLVKPLHEASAVIENDDAKRVVMHFLYDKVGKDKLVEGWNEGFAANNDKASLEKLQARIDTFNAMFDEDVVAGDQVVFEYLPGKGTDVTIKGALKGTIEGKDFNDALLSIWLGKEPVGSDLRAALLGK